MRNVIIAILLLSACTTEARTRARASAHVSWTASPSPGVTGYKVVWGKASRNYSNSFDCGKQLLVYLVGKFDRGVTYYFAVKAYNPSKVGPPSKEVAYRP